jgi:hypothetical protein
LPRPLQRHAAVEANKNSQDQDASKLGAVYNSTSELTDITLTHSEVASTDYLVLCSIFADYLGAGTWFQVKEDSEVKEVGGRKVQEVVVRLTSGGDDGNAMLLSDVWHDLGSMKDMLQVKMSEHMVDHSLVGWVKKPNLLTAMKSSAGMRSCFPSCFTMPTAIRPWMMHRTRTILATMKGVIVRTRTRTMPAGQEVAWDSGMKYGAVIAVLGV